jgi:uncharacterized membrane protein (DUF485 family)
MKSRLLILLLVPVAAYYLLLAFAPGVFALQIGGVPLSLPFAIGLIWLGFFVTLCYARAANRDGKRP